MDSATVEFIRQLIRWADFSAGEGWASVDGLDPAEILINYAEKIGVTDYDALADNVVNFIVAHMTSPSSRPPHQGSA